MLTYAYNTGFEDFQPIHLDSYKLADGWRLYIQLLDHMVLILDRDLDNIGWYIFLNWDIQNLLYILVKPVVLKYNFTVFQLYNN